MNFVIWLKYYFAYSYSGSCERILVLGNTVRSMMGRIVRYSLTKNLFLIKSNWEKKSGRFRLWMSCGCTDFNHDLDSSRFICVHDGQLIFFIIWFSCGNHIVCHVELYDRLFSFYPRSGWRIRTSSLRSLTSFLCQIIADFTIYTHDLPCIFFLLDINSRCIQNGLIKNITIVRYLFILNMAGSFQYIFVFIPIFSLC